MSEYQYYEFRTTGRRLSEKEMNEMRAVSSRGEITATSYTNEYNFGDFKGDPDKWMEKYFDAFLYLANWGSRELQLALPAGVLDVKAIKAYSSNEGVSVREKAGKAIVKFQMDEEPSGEWLEGEGNLSSLLAILDELAKGDYRSLYLGWLMSLQTGYAEDEGLEPEVPPNLTQLTDAQSSFVEFFGIDPDLLEAAARNSPRIAAQPEDRNELSEWVKGLPGSEKDTILTKLLTDGAGKVGLELQARFQRQRAARPSGPATKRRTVGEILAAADDIREEREEKERQKTARAKAERERKAALARESHLDSLKGKGEGLWREVDGLIATMQPKKYDLAIQHLVDLRDLAKRENRQDEFNRRLAELEDRHSGKSSLRRRMAEAGLS